MKISNVFFANGRFHVTTHEVLYEFNTFNGTVFSIDCGTVRESSLLKPYGYEGHNCYCFAGDELKAMTAIAESQKQKVNSLYDKAQHQSELYNKMLLLIIQKEKGK